MERSVCQNKFEVEGDDHIHYCNRDDGHTFACRCNCETQFVISGGS